jgi:hypothetical protein
MDAAEATWEPVDVFKTLFPDFQLEDELFVEGGEMLWWGTSISGVRRDVAEEWAVPSDASVWSPARARQPCRQEFVSRSF